MDRLEAETSNKKLKELKGYQPTIEALADRDAILKWDVNQVVKFVKRCCEEQIRGKKAKIWDNLSEVVKWTLTEVNKVNVNLTLDILNDVKLNTDIVNHLNPAREREKMSLSQSN